MKESLSGATPSDATRSPTFALGNRDETILDPNGTYPYHLRRKDPLAHDRRPKGVIHYHPLDEAPYLEGLTENRRR